MTLSQLIEECKFGNPIAQRQVFEAYYDRFFALASRYLKTDVEVEDVLSTAFTTIFKHIATFHFVNDMATVAWMKKIVVNTCLQTLRLNNHFQEESLEGHEGVVFSNNTIAHLGYKELLNCIQQLPVGYRTVFNLFEIEGYSHKEIAQMLKISEQTSKSQLHKSKKQLQAIIKNILKAL